MRLSSSLINCQPTVVAMGAADTAPLFKFTTTFASDYGHEISLAGALQRDAMLGYCRKATGEKYLVVP